MRDVRAVEPDIGLVRLTAEHTRKEEREHKRRETHERESQALREIQSTSGDAL